jgi:hypothetical protein
MFTLRRCGVLAAVVVLGALSACENPLDTTPRLESIEVSGANTLMVNQTVQLHAQGRDQHGESFFAGDATWSSSDNSKATVSQTGVVTGHQSGGPVTITATAGGKTGTIQITVAGSLHANRTITSSETWTAANGPHVVQGEVTVDAAGSPTLTIAAGAEVRFQSNGRLNVGWNHGGTLVVAGTAAAPVLLTSAAATPAAGQWRGLNFTSVASSSSSLTHTTLQYCGGGGSSTSACITLNGQGVSAVMNDVTVRHSGGHGIYLLDQSSFGAGSANLHVRNTALHVVVIHPNRVATIPAGGSFTDNAANAVRVYGGYVLQSQSWPNLGIPYVVTEDVTVDGSGTVVLTISAGTHLRFNSGARMNIGWNVGGALIAQGTAAAPVVFTADAAAPAAGHWRGLNFTSVAAPSSSLSHTTVEYCGGGGSSTDACILLNGQNVSAVMNDVTVRHSGAHGLYLLDQSSFGAGSANLHVRNTAQHVIAIHPNRVVTIPTGGSFANNVINAVGVYGGYVLQSQSWPNLGIPYVIQGDVTVDGSGTAVLTISAGTHLRFSTATRMNIGWNDGGALIAQGTPEAPILFTADAATPAAGHWYGLNFTAAASTSSVSHAIVEYGGRSSSANLAFATDLGAMLTNTIIRHSSHCGVRRWSNSDGWATDFTAAAHSNTFTANSYADQCGP